jgi:hypothetical protein
MGHAARPIFIFNFEMKACKRLIAGFFLSGLRFGQFGVDVFQKFL